MLNFIKMDFYRLFKSLSFWITIAATAIIAVIMGIFYNLLDSSILSLREVLLDIFSSTDILIICTIFISLFVHAEFKNGFIKNIAGQINHRSKLVISKFIIMITYMIITILVYMLIFTFIMILYGNELSLKFSGDLLIFIGIELILHFAFGATIIMLVIISNSNALSIAIGIMMSTGVFSLLYTAIDYVIYKIDPGISFSSSDYSLMNNLKYMVGYEGSELIRALCVGLIFGALSLSVAMFVIEKKDIK